jgi:beta-galactosidase beta subunit
MRLLEEKITVKCLLTGEEKIKYSEEQSKDLVERSEKEAELQAYSKQLKADIASLDARIVALATKINNGYEHRAVACKIEYDWQNKIKKWIRSDTEEIVKEDIIPESELQEEANL